ncbi:MAG: ATP-binding cassette domain-containing protein [Eubacteriales bacterium]|nr:ATP-binding cassette domain-containing protein [Eubacteriales bacterium]
MIEFKNVTKAYKNGKNVLNGLNLSINDGEFVFIIGDTGAGKTTMMKLLLCEERIDSGSLTVAGFNLGKMSSFKLPRYRRKLGVVFQDFRLFPGMTVEENVAFALRVVGTPRKYIPNKVRYILKTVQLENKLKSYPGELSGGEQQRVALARALVNSPDIIIADEPTGNIDPDMSRAIMDLLVMVNNLNKTVIVVTHERDLVQHYGKRTVLLKDGKAVELSPRGDMK